MHRLLADLTSAAGISLSREAERHMKVLRLEEGEEIELFDGKGKSVRCRIAGGRPVPCGEVAEQRRPESPITLFACVTKGSRWDWTIEKATELGISRIVPVISARTIARIAKSERAAKRDRWTRIAEDAARQSDAKWIPEILEATDFADALKLAKESRCFAGALTDPRPRPLIEAVLAAESAEDYSVFIGPEGDFTPEELSRLLEFAVPASFGESILRAETAAIYAISVLMAAKRK